MSHPIPAHRNNLQPLAAETDLPFACECGTVSGTLLQVGPELAAGLRMLLEAKDCFVRQALLDRVEDEGQ